MVFNNRVSVLNCLSKPYRKRVKPSHVIVKCRVIRNDVSIFWPFSKLPTYPENELSVFKKIIYLPLKINAFTPKIFYAQHKLYHK